MILSCLLSNLIILLFLLIQRNVVNFYLIFIFFIVLRIANHFRWSLSFSFGLFQAVFDHVFFNEILLLGYKAIYLINFQIFSCYLLFKFAYLCLVFWFLFGMLLFDFDNLNFEIFNFLQRKLRKWFKFLNFLCCILLPSWYCWIEEKWFIFGVNIQGMRKLS